MLGGMRHPATVRPRTALPARSKRLVYAGSLYVARTMRRASHITRPAGRARGAALASEGRAAAGARRVGGGRQANRGGCGGAVRQGSPGDECYVTLPRLIVSGGTPNDPLSGLRTEEAV